ncbi:MAG TPA: dihydropyrimidinase [Bauldia sp.]|nr:dihydropyrimidinase [Bauldia sp.]
MEYDYVFKGGLVTTAEASVELDLAISGDKIAAIGTELRGRETIDARGLLVLPGGIDPHTHFGLSIGTTAAADDYESGTRAAAFGGVTSFINYVFQEPDRTLLQAVDGELAKAEGKSYLDYGFHVAITDPDAIDVEREVAGLAERGLTSLKIFTAIGNWQLHRDQILRVMQAAADNGLIVNVHAEDGPLANHLTKRLIAQGKKSIKWLPQGRPPASEALAVSIVTTYAEALGCALYIVHLSCEAALDVTRAARRRGAKVFVETRPIYLFLDDSVYELPGIEGNKYSSAPPLRPAADQKALWIGLANGDIQAYGTDHVPWTAAQMMRPELDFSQIPGGASNAETSIGMLYSEGVEKSRISLRRFVELTSSNPARIYGMDPAKGSLTVGSDADVMLFDPKRKFKIVTSKMQSKGDLDPYDGYESNGWPVFTMSRGEIIVRDGKIVAKPGRGRFLKRKRHAAI